ncbi:MAG: serine hydrolase [Planctomycetes bacterium]|nr:serine hydrolase [Planctomycetota bacterium]
MKMILTGLIILFGIGVIAAQDSKPDAEEELSDGAKEILKKLDKNGDGEISGDEMPKRAKRFIKRYDVNGDGKISGDELNKVAEATSKLKKAGDAASKSEVAKSMKDTYEKDKESGLYLQAAHDYHKATAGEALYILKDGKPVFEVYDAGYKKETRHRLASGTKSFIGIVAACAVEDGLMKWDEKVCHTVTEWKKDQRKEITVRMLLSLSAGLPPSQDALQGPQTKDKYEYAIGLKCKSKPGTKFEYGPADYFAFGEFMKRKLAASEKFKEMNITDYFMHKIGDALEMKMTWDKDRSGNPSLPHGIHIVASEWAKFGEFVRLRGKHGDKQLLKTELMDECFKPSKCNAGYGLTWWLGGSDSAEGDAGGGDAKDAQGNVQKSAPKWMPQDMVFAAGKGKQKLFITRDMGLTIVRLAEDKQSFDNTEFWSWMLRGKGTK